MWEADGGWGEPEAPTPWSKRAPTAQFLLISAFRNVGPASGDLAGSQKCRKPASLSEFSQLLNWA